MLGELVDKLVAKVEGWLESVVLMLPNLGVALATLLLVWIAARLSRKIVRRLLERMAVRRSLIDLVGKFTVFLWFAIGIVVVLHILSLEKAATTFLAGAGILGLALGFAFQDLTANFIAGVALAVRRPLEVGDLIEVQDKGIFGRIQRIQLRTTLVKSPDGRSIIVPNRKLFEDVLINHSLEGLRRVELEVGVAYDSDLELVERIVRGAIEKIDQRVEDRPVDFFFLEFADSSINFVVRYWINFSASMADFYGAQHEAVLAVSREFREHGVTIPFPIRTLDFGSDQVGGVRYDHETRAPS